MAHTTAIPEEMDIVNQLLYVKVDMERDAPELLIGTFDEKVAIMNKLRDYIIDLKTEPVVLNRSNYITISIALNEKLKTYPLTPEYRAELLAMAKSKYDAMMTSFTSLIDRGGKRKSRRTRKIRR